MGFPIEPPTEQELITDPKLELFDVQNLNASIPRFAGRPIFSFYLESGEPPVVCCYVWHNFNDTAEISIEQLNKLIDACRLFHEMIVEIQAYAHELSIQTKQFEAFIELVPELRLMLDATDEGITTLEVLETASRMALRSYETELENRIESASAA